MALKILAAVAEVIESPVLLLYIHLPKSAIEDGIDARTFIRVMGVGWLRLVS
jgi:hypothetical protein